MTPLKGIMSKLKMFQEGATLEELKAAIPEEVLWLHRMLPVFDKYRGQTVYAVLGNMISQL